MKKEELEKLLEGVNIPIRRIERVVGMPTGTLSKARREVHELPKKWRTPLRQYVARVKAGVDPMALKPRRSKKSKIAFDTERMPPLNKVEEFPPGIDLKWGDKQGDGRVDDTEAINKALDSIAKMAERDEAINMEEVTNPKLKGLGNYISQVDMGANPEDVKKLVSVFDAEPVDNVQDEPLKFASPRSGEEDLLLGHDFRIFCDKIGKDPREMLSELNETYGKAQVVQMKEPKKEEIPGQYRPEIQREEPIPGTNAFFIRYGKWH